MIAGCARSEPRLLRGGRAKRVSGCTRKVVGQLRREQRLQTMTARYGDSASAHDVARRNTRVRSVARVFGAANLGASRLSTLNRRLEGVSSTKRFAASMAR